MTELEALKAENVSLKGLLSQANAEKTAIDQYCLENIKSNLQLRTQALLTNENFNKEFAKVSAELQDARIKLTELESRFHASTKLHAVTDDAVDVVCEMAGA